MPGPDFTPDVAAALLGCSANDGRRLLDKLSAAHLVHQYLAGRYQFHDLLHEYASMLARGGDDLEVRTATVRLLEFYLLSTDNATRLLYPHVLRLPVEPNPASHVVEFNTESAAIDWIDAECANLVAAAIHGPDLDGYDFAWRIADALRGYFPSRGQGRAGIAVCTAALNAARPEPINR